MSAQPDDRDATRYGPTPPPADPAATRYSDDKDAARYSGETPHVPPPTPPVRPTVPGYEILEELDRGGMGVVYKARQVGFNRIVALKMILSGAHAGPEERERFRIETEAVARLQHPNIVQVYEVGEHEGKPYFSMEFCPGGSLGKKLNGTPLPPKEAAGLAETLARAVQAAHDKGVVHRDLKPANVLLAEDGTPKVVDFGLAKRMDAVGQTQSGAVMGTPSYMAPEQAGGKSKEIGPACDVYALGAILYECLTGRPPFKGPTTLDTLTQVLADDPVRPRQLQPTTPRELEAICLKCLEKPPARRYSTAADLAADLGRWRRGEPVQARPVRGWERALKWVRRHPLQTAVYGLLLVVLLLGGVGGGVGWLWLDAVSAKRRAEKAEVEAIQARKDAETANLATHEALNGEQQERKAKEKALDKLEVVSYLDRINLAQREWQNKRHAQADELVEQCAEPFRSNWEWKYLHKLYHGSVITLPGHADAVLCVAFSPDGRRLASSSSDRTVKVWDLDSRKETLTLTGHKASVGCVAFSPDGRRLASASEDFTIKVWDVDSGQQTLNIHEGIYGQVVFAAFSPDGRRLAAATCSNGPVPVWDLETGEVALYLKGHTGDVYSVAFSPDGRRLASASRDHTVKVWDADTGQEALTLTGHTDSVWCVAFSPDGRRLASSSADKTVKVWNLNTGKEACTLAGHAGPVRGVAFSPDGRRLASSSVDKTVKVWDLDSGKEAFALAGHADEVKHVAFSPDGRRLASASRDHTVKVWNLDPDKEARTVKGSNDGGTALVAFSPDGRRVAGGWFAWAQVWDLDTGKEVLARLHGEYSSSIMGLAFSPDGRYLASGGSDKTVRVWDLNSGKEALTLTGHKGDVISVAFSPDSRRLASGGSDKTVRVWDLNSRKETLTLPGPTTAVRGVAFSPDGRRLASASSDGTVKVWDLDSGKEALTLTGHTGGVLSVAFSPDGRRLASGSSDRTVKVWDADTGQEALTLLGHVGDVTTVAFSPDGRCLASASSDGTVKVWVSSESPGEREQRWLTEDQRHAEFYKSNGQSFAAAFYLKRLSQREPNNTDLQAQYLNARGEWHAEGREWDDAIADFAEAARLKSSENPWFRYNQGLVLLGKDDHAGYHRVVAQMLSDFDPPRDTSTADAVAYLGVLLPPADAKQAASFLRLAEFEVATEPDNADYLETLGAALYRAGRYAEAVHRLNEAAEKKGNGGTADTQFFLAMAHHRLARAVSAPQALALLASPAGSPLLALPTLIRPDWPAQECYVAAVKKMQDQQAPTWTEKLRCRLLHDEAAALLGIDPDAPPTDRRGEP